MPLLNSFKATPRLNRLNGWLCVLSPVVLLLGSACVCSSIHWRSDSTRFLWKWLSCVPAFRLKEHSACTCITGGQRPENYRPWHAMTTHWVLFQMLNRPAKTTFYFSKSTRASSMRQKTNKTSSMCSVLHLNLNDKRWQVVSINRNVCIANVWQIIIGTESGKKSCICKLLVNCSHIPFTTVAKWGCDVGDKIKLSVFKLLNRLIWVRGGYKPRRG